MVYHYSFKKCSFYTLLAVGLGIGFTEKATAQAPTVSTLLPARNALAATRLSPISVGFSGAMNLSTASLATLPSYSAQRGGRKAGSFAASTAATIDFQPTSVFRAGELISRTLTTGLRSASGTALAKAQVYQFTTDAAPATGTFTGDATDIVIGTNSAGVVAVDLNNDGILDIATADRGGTIGYSLGTGAGKFANTTNIGVGGSYLDVTAADLNGDGFMDLIIPRIRSSEVLIFLNKGLANSYDFNSYSIYANDDARYAKAVDLDGDGDLDLLISCYSGSVAVKFNNGSGVFSSGTSIAIPTAYGLATGDIDNDGDIDFLATNYDANKAVTQLNDGKGVFTAGPVIAVGSGPLRAALGDLNADGYLDALVANNTGNSVSVALNTGKGAFSPPTTVAAPHAADVVLGDVDGDGDLDFVASDYSYGVGVSVRLNDGTGAFSTSANVGVAGAPIIGNANNYPFGTALADLDGNGTLDLLAATFSGFTSVRLNKFVPATLTSTASAVCSGLNSGTLAFTRAYGVFQKYQADTGTGFQDVAGSAASPTLAFSNLTATTTYRAVFLTAEDATVYSASATVVVNPLPVAAIQAAGATTFCQGGSVRLTASGGATYLWNTGATTASITATTSGTYSVVATSAAGCVAAAPATSTVTVNPGPVASLTAAGPTTFCQGGSVQLLASSGRRGSKYQFFRNNAAVTSLLSDSVYAAAAAGTYKVVVTTSAGCAAASPTTLVYVNEVPPTPSLTATTSGGVTTLTSSAPLGNQFYFNGSPIAGATDQTYVVGASAPAGSYTVAVTNASGCSSAQSAALAVVLAVQPASSATVALYPNPTGDQLTISLQGYPRAVDFILLNALGQPVRRGTLAAGTAGLRTHVLELRGLPAGIYLLQAASEGRTTTLRLVRE
jgi:hypothetical protein